jgi:hypothetical protein
MRFLGSWTASFLHGRVGEGFGMLFVVIIYLVGRIFVCGMKHFWMLYVYLFMLRQWAGGYKKIKETETEI